MIDPELINTAIDSALKIGGLIVLLFTGVLGGMWYEVKRIGGVRHKDREHLIELEGRYRILEMDFEQLEKSIDLRLKSLKWMIEEKLDMPHGTLE